MHIFTFSSKANTLRALCGHEELHIPVPIIPITVAQWRDNQDAAIGEIRSGFPAGTVAAVRSSCLREDSEESSAAGAYTSILNIRLEDVESLRCAVDSVIASYGEAAPEDQVLVQPMIKNSVVSGVITTRVLTDGAPYYVINYDDESGRTDTITGGHAANKTVYVYRDVRDGDFDSPRLRAFVGLARQLEKICGSDALDIEFCLDADDVLHLLQVRPICTQKHWPEHNGDIRDFIRHGADFIASRTGHSTNLFGQVSILGVMPDWNPAEMIGILPHPLASSLYRNLITAQVWSDARSAMGYRPLPATELMVLLMGRPYIDVRASFNSFLPDGLDQVICRALVSAWLERLDAKPHLHDKIEFEIAQTVLDFCFDQHLDERYPGLLSTSQRKKFRSALQQLTALCLDDSPTSSMNQAFDAVAELRARQADRPLVDSAHPLPLSSVQSLLLECRRQGTLPFSILARHAFIAESLLRTAVSRGAMQAERVRDFKLSFKTIAGELSREFFEVSMGRRDSLGFMRKYGHLRPSSYDILSPRYIDRQNLFSDSHGLVPAEQHEIHFEPTAKERHNLQLLLDENSLPISPDQLFLYAKRAIAGRELAKFIFSRNLSDVLEILAFWGESCGFDREAVSFMDLQTILDWSISAMPVSAHEFFQKQIDANRELFARSENLKIGYLIRSARDLYVAPQHRAAPNYVGSGQANAEVVRLYADSSCDTDLNGKIVCIENADPGFDWIFTRPIAGLVTKFGGANSHMAIRCAEYGLPAAIGVGEHLFQTVAAAKQLLLDPRAAILKAC